MILVNGLRTPDGTEIYSRTRHDYVTHVDAITGHEYMIDGGLDYVRCSAHGDEVMLTAMSTGDHTEDRQHMRWGTRGRNGDEPLVHKKLVDLSVDHIEAILSTLRLSRELRARFEAELIHRKGAAKC